MDDGEEHGGKKKSYKRIYDSKYKIETDKRSQADFVRSITMRRHETQKHINLMARM